jgi:RimJ/RimL family protein N-acetyltransferase
MPEKFPKEVKLKSGNRILLRLLEKKDLNQLVDFFQIIPIEDRMYLRSDVIQPDYVMRRFGEIDYEKKFPVLAFQKDQIIGIGTLFRAEFGWERHLGELRCVVRKDFQRQGLCTILVRELFLRALKTDLYKIQAEMMEDQKSAIAAFKRMGFHQEAVLEKHVTDINGNRRNLVIMSLDIQELWSIMEDFIPDSIYVT